MDYRDKLDLDYDVHVPARHGQTHRHPINLDIMHPDDLETAECNLALHDSVREYAGLRAEAMKTRAIGQVGRARCMEKKLRRIYESIPSQLRW